MRIRGKTVFVHRHRQRFLWKLDWVIMNEVAFCPNPYFLIHGGVVTRGGCAVLLHGSKGVGKTTLILALLLRGWQYLSDDISAVHPESLLAVPFPRNFSVGKDVRTLFGPAPAGDEDEDQIRPRKPLPRYANIARLWEGSLAAPSPVTHIVFPQYRPDATPALTPIGRAAALDRLASRAWGLHHFEKRGVDILTDLVMGAECSELTVGPLQETCQLLEDVCGA